MNPVDITAASGESDGHESSERVAEKEAVWAVLRGVLDPEVPVLSVVELGVVREVEVGVDGAIRVILTPTYSGCPATEAIADAIRGALKVTGSRQVSIEYRLAPAWTTDWLDPAAGEKLRRYGIAPPAHWVGPGIEPQAAGGSLTQPLRFHRRGIECPRCGSSQVEQLSAFGATACKALYRCLDCREPFEYFKPF